MLPLINNKRFLVPGWFRAVPGTGTTPRFRGSRPPLEGAEPREPVWKGRNRTFGGGVEKSSRCNGEPRRQRGPFYPPASHPVAPSDSRAVYANLVGFDWFRPDSLKTGGKTGAGGTNTTRKNACTHASAAGAS